MNFTVNTFIGIITALSGIIIAVITSWVSRKRDSEGIITTREAQVHTEVWQIIEELKQSAKQADERNDRLAQRVETLETELRASQMREFTLSQENARLIFRVQELERQVKILNGTLIED